ncbi:MULTISPECIES: hypothetical protein [Flagellimonas]|nr:MULTISPECIES: hypothetical protein [Allomuricauda]
MKGHWIWMVIGCGIPLLLIFFAPALGITGYNGIFAFILLMFAVHLLIPHGGHGRHGGHKSGSQGHAGHGGADHEHRKAESIAGTEEEEEEHKGHRHH